MEVIKGHTGSLDYSSYEPQSILALLREPGLYLGFRDFRDLGLGANMKLLKLWG